MFQIIGSDLFWVGYQASCFGIDVGCPKIKYDIGDKDEFEAEVSDEERF